MATRPAGPCAVVLAGVLALGSAAVAEAERTTGLLSALESEFVERNPRASRVTLLDLTRHSSDYREGTGYIVLAHGIRSDFRFEGSFEDELFGLFLVDRDLSRVVEVLRFIPSPRWGDYTFSIEKIDHSTSPWKVVLVGAGSTHGDLPKRVEVALPEPE